MTATVNYATERATVNFDPARSADRLVDAVEAAGYTRAARRPAGRDRERDETARCACG